MRNVARNTNAKRRRYLPTIQEVFTRYLRRWREAGQRPGGVDVSGDMEEMFLEAVRPRPTGKNLGKT